MKRKRFLLTPIILVIFLAMTACGQKDIGEAKAKETGLALINLAFDVNETEAVVKMEERPGLSYINGIQATFGGRRANQVLYR